MKSTSIIELVGVYEKEVPHMNHTAYTSDITHLVKNSKDINSSFHLQVRSRAF